MDSSDRQPAVLVRHLVVRRGPSLVLDDLDLELAAGEVLAIQGASGSGKSSLLLAIAGLIVPDSGTVVVDGRSMAGEPDRVRSAVRLERLGMVFQQDELIPELTIAENVGLPLRLTRRSSDEDAIAIRSVLESLDIAAIADSLPAEVSGGQLQRAAVARATINGPSLLLADEPTGSLDAAAARTAMELLVQTARARGTAVIVVTHDQVVADACDRALVLDGRRLIEVGG